jgi:1,4-dihydroxy-2-naphthoate octaprenyltransferase
MANSKEIAGLVGPTLMVMTAGEFPLFQPHLYDQQIPPVVYLNGMLLFVAGLAIVRAHNIWRTDWTVLVTLCGWCCLLLGITRVFSASSYQRSYAQVDSGFVMGVVAALFVLGAVLTVQAYRRG